MKKTTTVFGLLRHAETEWNRDKRIQGNHDAPLTEGGRRAAIAWGPKLQPLHWNAIVASPLGRAVQTARHINEHLKLPLEKGPNGLGEQDWGKWTGKRLPELEADPSGDIARQVTLGWRFCPPGGETREAVWKRAFGALCDMHSVYPGKKILVVTHEGVVKALLYRLLGRRFLPEEPAVLNKGRYLHLVSCERRSLRIDQINAVKL